MVINRSEVINWTFLSLWIMAAGGVLSVLFAEYHQFALAHPLNPEGSDFDHTKLILAFVALAGLAYAVKRAGEGALED